MLEFEKKERTNILPLRWFGNACESIANFYLGRYMEAEYKGKNWILPIYENISGLFYKPGFKWGTYYTAIFSNSNLEKKYEEFFYESHRHSSILLEGDGSWQK